MNNVSGLNHFSIPSKVAPAPESAVINLSTLDQALHPDVQGAESRATTPGGQEQREPMEITFLSDLEALSLRHNFTEELCNCPWKSVVEFRTPDNNTRMKAYRIVGCCKSENFEVFNYTTNELAILIEPISGSCGGKLGIPQSIQVYGPPGKSIGYVEKNRGDGCSSMLLYIKNAIGNHLYTVEPNYSCCGPTIYPVVKVSDNVKVAEIISGSWTCSWTLNLTFIENLSPSKKALIIGLAVLVDMIEMDRKNNHIRGVSGVVTGIAAVITAVTVKKKK